MDFKVDPIKSVENLAHQIELNQRSMGPHQYLRELVQNSIEAGATEIRIEPNPVAAREDKILQFMLADNGKGMTPGQLYAFINAYGIGGKSIGGRHQNFGIGGKTACLTWNKRGMVVISWQGKSDPGALIQIAFDGEHYGAVRHETDDGIAAVVCPFNGYEEIRNRYRHWDSGTVVILLGNDDRDGTSIENSARDTWRGPVSHRFSDSRFGAVMMLNARYLDGFGTCKVSIWTPIKGLKKKGRWMQAHYDAAVKTAAAGVLPNKSGQWRSIQGARTISGYGRGTGNHVSGRVMMGCGTEIEWLLYDRKYNEDGEEVSQQSGGRLGLNKATIAATYRGELYAKKTRMDTWARWGITSRKIVDRMMIYIHVAEFSSDNGVESGAHPNPSREVLLWGEAGGELPFGDWSDQFRASFPNEIHEALDEVRSEVNAESVDVADEIKQRAFARFFSRFRRQKKVIVDGSGKDAEDGEVGEGRGESKRGHGPRRTRPIVPGKGTRTSKPGGKRAAESRPGPSELVNTDWRDSDDFDGQVAGRLTKDLLDQPILFLNRDFPVFTEMQEHWVTCLPEYANHSDAVRGFVKGVLEASMAVKITHALALPSLDKTSWTSDAVRLAITPEAITIAAMGIWGEEEIIATRLPNFVRQLERGGAR